MAAALSPAARALAAAACSVALTAAAQAPALNDSAASMEPADTAWSAIFRADLDSLRAFISANHPGSVDSRNSNFARTLASAYDEAVRDTSRITSYTSYAIALARFGNRFEDAHLAIAATRPLGEIREAGIYPVYRGAGFMVAEVDARYGKLAPVLLNATVLGCGPLDVRQIFSTRVLPWRGRQSVEADWYRWAPLLFTDYGPPMPPGPQSCRFAIGDRIVELPLQWRRTQASIVRDKQLALTRMPERHLSVERKDEGRTIWVNVPTFAANSEAEISQMLALLDSLRTVLKTSPKRSLLVIDLRGNEGGSSRWGTDIVRILFGDPWTRRAQAWLADGVFTEWRVSSFNMQALDNVFQQVESRHGAESADAKRMRALRDSMTAALERGDSLYGETQRRRNIKKPGATRVRSSIVVLTSASCFSACLDFLDLMLLHPAVVHAGQTTGVDTHYMENWGMQLASGLASIGYPMNVYRNRRRGHNAAYVPKAPYEHDIRDTRTLEAWIVRNHKSW
jgi:hypothetical protein